MDETLPDYNKTRFPLPLAFRRMRDGNVFTGVCLLTWEVHLGPVSGPIQGASPPSQDRGTSAPVPDRGTPLPSPLQTGLIASGMSLAVTLDFLA